jgi:hypothetical protein
MAIDMMAALIQWRIKPDKRSNTAFRKHWKCTVSVKRATGLGFGRG